MRRLFVQLLVGFVGAVVLAQLLGLGGSWLFTDAASRRVAEEALEADLDWAVERLDPLERHARREEVRRLGAALHAHLHLIPPGKLPPPDRQQRVLADGSVLVGAAHLPPPPVVHQLGVVLLPLLLLAWVLWVARGLVRDLETLERTAKALDAGDLDARARLSGPAAQLGRAVDGMADTVQALLRNQTSLVNAVSHEIRTPLARMRFQLEALAADVDVGALDEELDAIDHLLRDLLAYQRLGEVPLEPAQPERTSEVIQQTVERMRVLSSHAIDVELDGSLEMSARDLSRIVENLLSNALRHAQSRVVVRLGPDSLVVEDDGLGIADAVRETLFLPFSSGDSSRGRELGGIGLGLPLVVRSAERWDYRISAGRSALGGAHFRVSRDVERR